MNKKNENGVIDHFLIVALVLVVGLGGVIWWRVSSTNNNKTPNVAQIEEQQEVSEIPEDHTSLQTLDKVVEIAKNQNENLEILNIELKSEDGSLVYKVLLSDGTVLFIEAMSGEVLGTGKQELNTKREPLNGDISNINIADAVAKAKGERPGLKVVEVEIETEDGQILVVVKFEDESKVGVNPVTGQIDRVRVPGADDDFDDDDRNNIEDDDDDNDGNHDERDDDDDNDGRRDDEDDNDDNDDLNDDEDEDEEEVEDEDEDEEEEEDEVEIEEEDEDNRD